MEGQMGNKKYTVHIEIDSNTGDVTVSYGKNGNRYSGPIHPGDIKEIGCILTNKTPDRLWGICFPDGHGGII
jgi:hypothetical protein